jgi:hypothetical protein
VAGQKVEVLRPNGKWVGARVEKMWGKDQVLVRYADGGLQAVGFEFLRAAE